jgi:hypothetical protein
MLAELWDMDAVDVADLMIANAEALRHEDEGFRYRAERAKRRLLDPR